MEGGKQLSSAVRIPDQGVPVTSDPCDLAVTLRLREGGGRGLRGFDRLLVSPVHTVWQISGEERRF